MEKQLELKEATTRRKILALKQQLQGNGTQRYEQRTSTTRDVPSSSTSNIPSMSPAPLNTKQTLSSPSPVYTNQYQNVSNSKQSVRVLQSPAQTTPTSPPLNSNPVRVSIESSHYPDSQRLWQKNSTRNDNSSSVPSDQPSRARLQVQDISEPFTSTHTTKAFTTLDDSDKANSEQVVRITSEKRQSQEHSKDTSTTEKPVPKSQSSNSTRRDKLTLPEEIKETEYMSALQRQKARVSRIRRCIVAATVIQRAWRDYKNNHG